MDNKVTLLDSLNPRNDLVDEPSFLQFKVELDAALSNCSTIKNIAIAGPYSSGKSSLIETYKANVNTEIVNVSLASFNLSSRSGKKDDNFVTETIDVEESILKNILYSVAPSKIPKSSYSRISAITKEKFNKGALIFLYFILIGTLLILPNQIHSGLKLIGLTNYSVITNNSFFNLSFSSITPFIDSIRLVLISLWSYFFIGYLSKHIWKITAFRFKAKVSGSGVDFTSHEAGIERKSFLNSKLDELLYFFEMNVEKRVIVFEDLDRLDDLSIFIKLREINHLLNQYKNINEKIVFIYAIRDDIFTNNERVKFFDLIIPVIPFIDNSNSHEILTEKLKLDKGYSISKKVIKELSYYIDDPRLLSNIISEFRYYAKRLDWDNNKNLDKLLALMAYKNIAPLDFADLQQGQGEVAEVLSFLSGKGLNDLLVDKKTKISRLTKNLEKSSNIPTIDIVKKKKVFLYSIFQYLLDDTVQVDNDRNPVRLSQALNNDDTFERLLTSDSISNWNGHKTIHQNQMALIFDEYNQHEEILNSHKLDQQNKLRNKIKLIELEIAGIRSKSTGMLAIQLIDNGLEEEISKLSSSWSDTSLIKYLITADLVSNDFHLYISEYHEGSKTKADMNFLKTISSKGAPLPYASRLDNPIVVLNELKPIHFSNKNVLNIDLIEHLLSIQDEKITEVREFTKLLRLDDKATDFISEYLNEAHHHKYFFEAVSKYWDKFSSWVIYNNHFDSKKKQDIVTLILDNMSVEFLEKQNIYKVLTDFINGNKKFPPSTWIDSAGDVRFALQTNESIFKSLNLRFSQLELTYLEEDVINLIIEGNYYEMSSPMILGFVKHRVIDYKDFDKSILTGILTLPVNDQFRLRVTGSIDKFVKDIMLNLNKNTNESAETLRFLSNQKFVEEDFSSILEQTDTEIPDIEGFNSDLWSQLFNSNKITNSWSNILNYFQINGLDDVLSKYLNNGYLNIKGNAGDYDKNSEESFFDAILKDESKLDLQCYETLTMKTNLKFNDEDVLRVLSFDRTKILIANSKIISNIENIDHLESRDDSLVVHFIIDVVDQLIEKDLLINLDLNQNTKAKLFASTKLDNKIKKILLSNITADELANKQLATNVLTFALSTRESLPDDDCLVNILVWSDNLKLKVKYLIFNADSISEEDLREYLELLPTPFNELLTNNNHTKLDDNLENRALVEHLISRNWISKMVDLKKSKEIKAIPKTSAVIIK